MSHEKVEVVRQAIAAVNSAGPEAALDLYAPDVEFREDPKFPEAQTYRGPDEVVRNFHEFRASFEEYHLEIEELRDAGDDRVLALLNVSARGRSGGLAVSRRSALVVTFRADRISCLEIYLDPNDAFEAVAMRE